MKQHVRYLPLKIFFRLLAIAYRLLYGPFAWTYDWVAAAVSLGMWRSWVFSVLPHLEGPHVLELGYGPGHLQVELHRRGLNPIGLDGSPQMSRQAHKRLKKHGYTAHLTRGQTQNLPFPAGSFDQVVSTFPSEYIVDANTLAEVWRVLADQGRLIVLPMAWITGKSWRHRLIGKLYNTTGQSPKWGAHLLQHLQQAGFSVQMEEISQKNSRLTLFVASKQTANPG
jgi:ubiquinone/menaquinone biosynthesis C-methylase UbiE